MSELMAAEKAYDASNALKQTVQELPDAKKGEGDGSFFWTTPGRAILLPPHRTRARAYALDAFYHHEYNWMGQSAIAGQGKKVGATHWKINGKNNVDYFQDLLRYADFKRGWTSFCEKAYLDFSRYDHGAWIEIIGPGNPSRPLAGRVTGLALLDPLQVYPTGDPDWPCVFIDEKGVKHLMPSSRVFQIVDAPETGRRNPGYGLCALSRAIAIVSQQINMNRYVDVNLDELPPPGMVVASNIEKGIRNAAFLQYQQEQATDGAQPWGRTAWFYSMDPSAAAKLEIITFAQAPASWDYEKYTNLHVNAWAMALGVDVQELWQLSGGNIGSAGQSEILHSKSQQRAFGSFLTRFTRLINDILPKSLEFEFVVKDPQAEMATAQAASSWAGFTMSVSATLSPDEQRRLLAATVEQYRDVVTDEDGKVVSLTDADPEAPDQTADDTGPAPEAEPQQEVVADSQKSYASTASDFESNLADLVRTGLDGDINRRRAGIVMRALLNSAGKQARADGLKEGGISSGLSDRDLRAHADWLAEQSSYVSSFLTDAYKDGLSPDAIEQHVKMWATKSLQSAYYDGLITADADGNYAFAGTDGEESCATCTSLKGRVMRLSEWSSKRLIPGVDTDRYDCKGYRCEHRLQKVTAS